MYLCKHTHTHKHTHMYSILQPPAGHCCSPILFCQLLYTPSVRTGGTACGLPDCTLLDEGRERGETGRREREGKRGGERGGKRGGERGRENGEEREGGKTGRRERGETGRRERGKTGRGEREGKWEGKGVFTLTVRNSLR